MPDLVLIALGGLLVLAVFVEAFMTTLAVSAGAGPLTSRVFATCWRGLLRMKGLPGGSWLLTGGGAVLLVLTVLVWVLWLWFGWTLVFAGSGAVEDGRTSAPAGTLDTVYFTGMTLFTLGTGDVVAGTPGWRVVMAVAGFSGLFLVTLTITYLISVVSAVVMRRSLAIQVRSLGDSSTAIVVRGWAHGRFTTMFEQQLVGLTQSIATSAEQHLAYPVLHYFHAGTPDLAAARAVADLDEALLLLGDGVAEGHRPDPSVLGPLRFTVERYLATASDTSWSPHVAAPPAPGLRALEDAEIPLAPVQAFAAAVARDVDRRTTQHRLVVGAGWTWPVS